MGNELPAQGQKDLLAAHIPDEIYALPPNPGKHFFLPLETTFRTREAARLDVSRRTFQKCKADAMKKPSARPKTSQIALGREI